MDSTIRLRPIPKYLSVAGTSFQQAIAYRVTTLFNIALTFIWVFILYYLWMAAYSGRDVIGGFSWDEMRTYVVLAYAINALVGWRVGSQMMGTIRNGEILRELVRPMNYCGTQISMAAGFSVVEGIVSLLITLALGIFVLDIQPPDSPLMAVLFVVSLFVGFITKALIVFSVSLLTFWTLNGVGLMWAQQAIISVLSGTLVPIALMPDWLRIISEVLPMRGIVSTPLMLYLGKASGMDAVGLLALQLAWALGLWFFANWAWQRAFNAVEIQGGELDECPSLAPGRPQEPQALHQAPARADSGGGRVPSGLLDRYRRRNAPAGCRAGLCHRALHPDPRGLWLDRLEHRDPLRTDDAPEGPHRALLRRAVDVARQGKYRRVRPRARPISPALQSATALVSIHGLGQVILGVVVLWMGISRSDMAIQWWTVPYLLLIVAASAVMIGALNFVINMIGFWEPSAQSALPTMLALLIDFAKFPLDIYNMVIRGLVTIIMPYAFISYFPAQLLLDRDTGWQWLGLATPLVTVLVVLATSWLWGKALNRYQGVGH